MKHINKWMFLGLFIFFIILGIYVDFYNNQEKENNNEINELKELYNKKWFRYGVSISEDDVVVNESFQLIEKRYIYFTEDYVEYCDDVNVGCNKYNYSYNNGKLFIDSGEFYIGKGNYDIELSNEKLQLSAVFGDYKYVHYLSTPI